VRDKRLHTGAQKRLEVKISTRKLLEKTTQKKEERKAERDKISERLQQLSTADLVREPAELTGSSKGRGLELSANFNHYAGEVPLPGAGSGAAPAKNKPVLSSQQPKPRSGLDADAPLLNKHYSGYRGEVELGDSGSPKKKPDLAALSSLRKNRLAKATSGQEGGVAGDAAAGSSSSSSSSSSSGFSSISGFSSGSERPHGGNPSPSSVANAPVLHGPSGNGGLSAEGSARLEAARASRNSKASSGASPLRAVAGGGPLPRPKPPTPRPRSPRAARTSPGGP
jgi:hypothetical protein